MTNEPSKLPRRKLWLIVMLALIAIAACSRGDTPSGAPGRGVYIPATWSDARTIQGHDVHVVQHKVACNQCHTLSATNIGPVTPARCASCHEKEGRIAHASVQARARLGDAVTSDCTLCHKFADSFAVSSFEMLPNGQPLAMHAHQAGDCAHCHSTRQALTPAVRIHETEKCTSCHKPHDDAKPRPAACEQCHSDIKPTHATANRSVVQICTTCHQKQHAPASDALLSCAPCHATEQPIVPKTALFESGHLECVGCHRPHEFAKEKAVACRSCHEDILVLGAGAAKGHKQCTNCHQPHDVKNSPDQRCAQCHTDKHPDHPKQGIAGSCVGCHDPHPSGAQAHSRVRNCSTCHQTAGADTGFHAGVTCKQCHAPHDFVREASDHSACATCHAGPLAKVATQPGHQQCQDCHRGLPHKPLLPTANCESCHARQQAQVNSGHTACGKCHEPHAGNIATGCANCHKQEQATALAGHQTCNSCHEPHSGSSATAPCVKCHSTEAQTKHGQITTGCDTCHRAHGPSGVASPPACTSCHEKPKLSGLHSVSQHQACNRCHTGHGETEAAARTACLSCHTDRKQHFPDASRCSSCHLFGKNR